MTALNTYKPKIGYASMNEDVRPNSYRTIRKSSLTDEKLIELIDHNLNVLDATLDYNIKNGNRMFRISSSLIPFGSSPLNSVDWGNEFKDKFDEMRDKIEKNRIRISMHPGQYTVLNSPNEDVVKASIKELEYHVLVMKLLGATKQNKLILHVGGIYGDKQKAIERFIHVYENELSDEIKNHLVIENDDKMYTVEDVLYISKKTEVPVVFDNLHHEVNPSLHDMSIKSILNKVVATWVKEDGKCKVHYSQQDTDKKPGAHSPTIFIQKFIEDYKTMYSLVDVDIMLEVKDKNRSFIKINQLMYPSMKSLEKEWARYKYWVMSRSQHAYNEVRLLFKDNKEVSTITFYSVIESLLDMDENKKSMANAFEHVWGYFKDIASKNEKDKFIEYIKMYTEGLIESKKILTYLARLTEKYQVEYLLESYYFG